MVVSEGKDGAVVGHGALSFVSVMLEWEWGHGLSG